MKVVKLRLKLNKQECLFDKFFLKENLGIDGDPKADGGDRQICIGDEAELCFYRAEDAGLCVKRYIPSISTEGLNYSSLSKGDTLRIGEAEIEITEIGKRCFPECTLVQEGKTCNMKRNCAFAKVIRSGSVIPGSEITI